MEFKLLSWNVNGIRAIAKKGFNDFLTKEKPDILGLQEIKITNVAKEEASFDFANYKEYWNHAERAGYSGTATLVKNEELKVKSYCEGLGIEEFDKEGRVQTMEFEKFYFVNVYFPNANHELSRLKYKLDFNDEFLKYVKKLEKVKPVVICGDFNVAHQEIDIARPKDNAGSAGFTIEERAWVDKLTVAGFVDTFRAIHPKKVQYSWWSYRFYARDRNIGWRIDYFFVSAKLKDKVKEAFILDEIFGSDHCPVGIILNI
jgi:exodeoxyribonuclease III